MGSTRSGLLEQVLDVLDSGTGNIASRRTEANARPGVDVLVHLESLAATFAWRQFLYYIRGSWRPFYIPSRSRHWTDGMSVLVRTAWEKPPQALLRA